jgi:hypothetical protein
MITANDVNAVRPKRFQKEDNDQTLDGELASVNQIAKKNICPTRRQTNSVEDAEEIENLAMDIPNDGTGRRHLQHDRFALENLFAVLEQSRDHNRIGIWKNKRNLTTGITHHIPRKTARIRLEKVLEAADV